MRDAESADFLAQILVERQSAAHGLALESISAGGDELQSEEIAENAELRTPTIARVMPLKIKRRISFSATNASRDEAKLAYIRLNSQLRKLSRAGRLARLVALSRLTRGVVGGFFTLNTRIAFGHGCDSPSYLGHL